MNILTYKETEELHNSYATLLFFLYIVNINVDYIRRFRAESFSQLWDGK